MKSSLTDNAGLSRFAAGKRSDTKQRVLHLNSGNLYGGVETILVTLARLRDQCPNLESHFGLCYSGRLSQELRDEGVPVYSLGKVRISRPWSVWLARHRLHEILRRERFDLVVCHMPWSLAIFGKTIRDAGIRLGFWAHAYHTGRNWLERMARRTIPDLAIANSQFTEAGLANLFPSSVLRDVIYPPVQLDARPAAKYRSTLRDEYGIDEETQLIIQVSRLEAWKGHRLHLEALARLKDLKKWVCWIVGGPQKADEEPYLRSLRQTASELGIGERVHFLGQRADVARLLSAADIFCQPNQQPEPFGIVFIEALWAGLPVVSTALGGALEIIDESCGILVRPDDVVDLATSLRALIQEPQLRSRLGAGGPRRAREISDPHKQMQNLLELSYRVKGSGR